MMLLFLIMPTPLPLSSQPATGLSALAPAQRAGAQRLCAMAPSGGPDMSARCLLFGGEADSICSTRVLPGVGAKQTKPEGSRCL